MGTTRPETLEFVATAPLRAGARRELDAPPGDVFDTLADASSWVHWFPGMQHCAWLTPAPHGVGSQREVRVGPLRVVERFVVWDRPTRWGFTFTAASPAIARAGVEVVDLTPADGGRTAVTYTMALDPARPAAVAPGLVARPMEANLAAALAGLDRFLATGRVRRTG